MSTTQDRGDHVFQCDVERCGETLETGTSNFEAARNLVRRAGWRPFQRNGRWLHRCAQCVKAGAVVE